MLVIAWGVLATSDRQTTASLDVANRLPPAAAVPNVVFDDAQVTPSSSADSPANETDLPARIRNEQERLELEVDRTVAAVAKTLSPQALAEIQLLRRIQSTRYFVLEVAARSALPGDELSSPELRRDIARLAAIVDRIDRMAAQFAGAATAAQCE